MDRIAVAERQGALRPAHVRRAASVLGQVIACPIVEQSSTLRDLVRQGRIAVVGAMYDVWTGGIKLLHDTAIGLQATDGYGALNALADNELTEGTVADNVV